MLVYAPDRLSRKYAYQILLIEELARHGVDTIFMQAPQAATAEDQLLVQFQGMIAEYERAQILERSRRGKRHRARQGQVNVHAIIDNAFVEALFRTAKYRPESIRNDLGRHDAARA